MRAKNDAAMQRAIANDNYSSRAGQQPAYRPVYGRGAAVRHSVDENRPPLSHRHQNSKQTEAEMMEYKHNIVKEQALRDLRRLI